MNFVLVVLVVVVLIDVDKKVVIKDLFDVIDVLKFVLVIGNSVEM